MTEKSIARWRVLCAGRVQHVGFRYSAFYLARALDLTGWVDNLPDGRVEMEVQGPEALLRRMLLQLRGRPHIQILDMEIREIDVVPEERRFAVRGYNDHRMAKSIGNPIDFAAKRQVWQRMILRIIRPMLIAMSIWQNSNAVLLRRKAARRKAFWLFAIL